MKTKNDSSPNSNYMIGLVAVSVIFFILWRYIVNRVGIELLMNPDEISSIQFATVGNNIIDVFREQIYVDPMNMPFYPILLRFAISIGGFSPINMRIVNEVITMLSVIMIGLVGSSYFGKRVGIIASVIAGTSVQFVYVSFQMRSYALMLFLSICLLLIRKYRYERLIFRILYLLSLFLISTTHHFGLIFSFSLGLWDLVWFIKKKYKLTDMLEYFFFLLLYSPLLIKNFIKYSSMHSSGAWWIPAPTYYDLFNMFYMLSPFGMIGLVVVLSVIIERSSKLIKEKELKDGYIDLLVWIVIVVMTIVFVSSKYINPNASVWLYRYFLVIFPSFVLITSYGIDCCISKLSDSGLISETMIRCMLMASSIVMAYSLMTTVSDDSGLVNTGGRNFYEVNSYLKQQDDILSEDTAVLYTYPTSGDENEGIMRLYCEGDPDILPNFFFTEDDLLGADMSRYRVIYVSDMVYPISEDMQSILDSGYELQEAGVVGLRKYVSLYQ